MIQAWPKLESIHAKFYNPLFYLFLLEQPEMSYNAYFSKYKQYVINSLTADDKNFCHS